MNFNFQTSVAFNTDEKIPGRRSSFGVTVSSKDKDSDFIDKEEMFSVHDFTPYKIAVGALLISNFPPITTKEADFKPFYWFCDVVNALLPDDIAAKKKKSTSPLSIKTITLGTDKGMRAKSLIKSQTPSLFKEETKDNKLTFEQRNIIGIQEYFKKRKKNENYLPTRDALYECCLEIFKFDPLCPKIPTKKHSLEMFYKWFGENFKDYEVFLYTLI